MTDWHALVSSNEWRTVATFPARFNSRCDDCDEPTEEGEMVIMQVKGADEDKRVIHENCEPWR